MDKNTFISNLNNDLLDKQSKIDTCQYYLANYPVNIHGFMVKLPLRISGGSQESVDKAFKALQSRIEDFKLQ